MVEWHEGGASEALAGRPRPVATRQPRYIYRCLDAGAMALVPVLIFHLPNLRVMNLEIIKKFRAWGNACDKQIVAGTSTRHVE